MYNLAEIEQSLFPVCLLIIFILIMLLIGVEHKTYKKGIILSKIGRTVLNQYYFIVQYDSTKVKKVEVDLETYTSFEEKDIFSIK